MKEVIYDRYGEDSKRYMLTESEFEKAVQDWKSGTPYWCERLAALLQPKFSFLETPEEYKTFDEILIDPATAERYGVRLEEGKLIYYAINFFEDGKIAEMPISERSDKDEIMARINGKCQQIDEFYDYVGNMKRVEAKNKKQEIKQLLAGK